MLPFLHYLSPTFVEAQQHPSPGPQPAAPTADPYTAIRQVLNTYPLAVDSKDFGLLSQVFAPNAVANYAAGVGILNGTAEIEAGLQAALALVTTQHALSTQVIEFSGPAAANSTTYYTASHFGAGVYEGKVLYAYGKYLDELECLDTGRGREDCEWRVVERLLVYMGPLIGNLSVFT